VLRGLAGCSRDDGAERRYPGIDSGSVGVSTLDLLSQVGADVDILALTAGRNVELLAAQARRWRPGWR